MRNTNFSLPVLQASRNTKRRRAWAFGVIKGALQQHVSLDAVGNVNYARLTPGGVAERRSAMPQPRKFASAKPPIGLRRCPSCGLPMLLSRVEPSDEVGRDERTFECAACAYAETTTVRVR